MGGLNAYSKGVSLGLFQPTPREVKEQRRRMRKEEILAIDLLHRAVPAKHTNQGFRALSGEIPIHPESVQKYLEGKFGDASEDVSSAMMELAKSLPPLNWRKRPIPCKRNSGRKFLSSRKGWGASGKLDLDFIRKMASA